MSDFIKAEKVVSTSLGLLEREVVLPRLVWRDAGGDFAGAKGDAITVRLPAFGVAQKRALRSGASRTKSALHERKIIVTLDTDVYMDVPVTDEELTLDIADFGAQVLTPVNAAIARGLEDELVDTITGADYDLTFEIDLDDLKGSFAHARELLNKARVPGEGRTLLIGSEVDSALIQLDNLVRFDQSNSTDTLREAMVGRVYGFNIVVNNEIDPGEAFAFHRTAYVMSSRAPVVPAGAPWGASNSFAGLAIRNVRVFDPDEVEDRFIADAWVGANTVTDQGDLDADGRFTPSEEPDDTEPTPTDQLFVRAVHLTEGS